MSERTERASEDGKKKERETITCMYARIHAHTRARIRKCVHTHTRARARLLGARTSAKLESCSDRRRRSKKRRCFELELPFEFQPRIFSTYETPLAALRRAAPRRAMPSRAEHALPQRAAKFDRRARARRHSILSLAGTSPRIKQCAAIERSVFESPPCIRSVRVSSLASGGELATDR